MNALVDTLLNVSVFIFIGLMVWLFYKDTPGAPSEAFDRRERDDGRGERR